MLVVGGGIAYVGYSGMNSTMRASLGDQFESLHRLLHERGRRLVEPIQSQLGLLIHDRLSLARNLPARLDRLPILVESLRVNPTVKSVYAGYPNGEFILVRRLNDPEVQAFFEAPSDAAFLVQTLTEQRDGTILGEYRYYDERIRLLQALERPDYDYDPRRRPWYQASESTGAPRISRPYLFYTTGEVGITVSRRAANAGAILGMDATLEQLAAEVADVRPTESSEVAILEPDGTLIAYTDLSRIIRHEADGGTSRIHVDQLGVPVLSQVAASITRGDKDHHGLVEVDGEDWIYSYGELDIGLGEAAMIVLAVPVSDMLSASRDIAQKQGVLILLILILAFPVGLFVVRQISRPLKALSEDVGGLASFEFDDPIRTRTRILEVSELSHTIDGMRMTIQRFLEINRAIAAEEDFDRLVRRLLDEIIATTDTEAGILYLTDADERRLVPHAARLDDQTDLEFSIPEILLQHRDNVVVRSIADENAESAEASTVELERCGLVGIDAHLSEPAQFLLAAPLYNRQKELVGVLLLIESHSMDRALVRFTEALSGAAAVSVETRQLIAAQKELFESFIQMIAGAIDAKSPYTGGHCARVPELTKMLAAEADRATDGPFGGFRLSEDDWEAIHVASWLHDCGKVTTPEFVVDKATKLETIYDRIHEVRMRVEVMKREAEIAFLRRVLETGGDPADDAILKAELAALDADFAFLAECNQGGEFMSPDRMDEIERIAGRTWTRTLDDRLGVSHDERARKERAGASPGLPVTEPLLSDRPEHLFARPEADRIAPDNPWGFRMDVPEYLYNRGEIHNLKVARGTLTDEDRYKINEHIVQTIKMLDRLPFPKHLRHVPELAGGHHEKMDGTGYPKRLHRDEMSMVARMMAVADIFEALTAVDRPYKKGKTLSEALRIMGFMVKDSHIDPDLFDIFLRSGIYLDYARKYLRPDQIDDIDLDALRRVLPAAE